tara:strand:+ start:207 stop:461 length:255 start_codon:yes stop_codon:yes gene_type:complete
MMKETIEAMRSRYTGDCVRPGMMYWMRTQLKGLIDNEIVEYCEDCDWLFPVGADHVEFLSASNEKFATSKLNGKWMRRNGHERV